MKVIRARAMGMCFGVRDALVAADKVAHPEDVTIYGELVHNETVLAGLDARGFHRTPEGGNGSPPTTPQVLITAHGISNARRRQLRATGALLVDTTCPLVRKVHDAAQLLERRGYHLVVIGKPGHVEVQGIVEDLQSYDVIRGVEEVGSWSHPRIGVVCQTTAPPALAAEIVEEIRRQNPEAEVVAEDTICQPTKDRGLALDELLQQVEVLVVVGGQNSNNTKQLVVRAEAQGLRAHHVQEAGDLRAEWFAGCDQVGLTAGTSTPEPQIDAVYQALLEIG